MATDIDVEFARIVEELDVEVEAAAAIVENIKTSQNNITIVEESLATIEESANAALARIDKLLPAPDDVTLTVGVDKDYTTIASALSDVYSMTSTGSNKRIILEIDEGTYSEALSISDLGYNGSIVLRAIGTVTIDTSAGAVSLYRSKLLFDGDLRIRGTLRVSDESMLHVSDTLHVTYDGLEVDKKSVVYGDGGLYIGTVSEYATNGLSITNGSEVFFPLQECVVYSQDDCCFLNEKSTASLGDVTLTSSTSSGVNATDGSLLLVGDVECTSVDDGFYCSRNSVIITLDVEMVSESRGQVSLNDSVIISNYINISCNNNAQLANYSGRISSTEGKIITTSGHAQSTTWNGLITCIGEININVSGGVGQIAHYRSKIISGGTNITTDGSYAQYSSRGSIVITGDTIIDTDGIGQIAILDGVIITETVNITSGGYAQYATIGGMIRSTNTTIDSVGISQIATQLGRIISGGGTIVCNTTGQYANSGGIVLSTAALEIVGGTFFQLALQEGKIISTASVKFIEPTGGWVNATMYAHTGGSINNSSVTWDTTPSTTALKSVPSESSISADGSRIIYN